MSSRLHEGPDTSSLPTIIQRNLVSLETILIQHSKVKVHVCDIVQGYYMYLKLLQKLQSSLTTTYNMCFNEDCQIRESLVE